MPSAAPGPGVVNIAQAAVGYHGWRHPPAFIVPGDDPPYDLIKRGDQTLQPRKHPDVAVTWGISDCVLAAAISSALVSRPLEHAHGFAGITISRPGFSSPP